MSYIIITVGLTILFDCLMQLSYAFFVLWSNVFWASNNKKEWKIQMHQRGFTILALIGISLIFLSLYINHWPNYY